MDKVTGLFGSVKKGIQGLTKRERVMIYGLVILIVLAILVFLIMMPAMTHISELNEEVSTLQSQEMEMRLKIADAASYDVRLATAEKSFKALKKQLYIPMDAESLDELVTSILVDSGMTPQNLTMTTLQQANIPAYIAPQLKAAGIPELTSDGAVAEDQNTDAAAAGGGADGASGVAAYVYTVDVTVEGDKSNLDSFVDNINSTTGVELQGYTYTTGSEDLTSGITTKGTITATISVYVYVDQATGNALPMAGEETQ